MGGTAPLLVGGTAPLLAGMWGLGLVERFGLLCSRAVRVVRVFLLKREVLVMSFCKVVLSQL